MFHQDHRGHGIDWDGNTVLPESSYSSGSYLSGAPSPRTAAPGNLPRDPSKKIAGGYGVPDDHPSGVVLDRRVEGIDGGTRGTFIPGEPGSEESYREVAVGLLNHDPKEVSASEDDHF
jgi:hypothetical protein